MLRGRMHWPVEDLGPLKLSFFLPPGAGGKVDFPLLYEKSDPLAAGRSARSRSGWGYSARGPLGPYSIVRGSCGGSEAGLFSFL